MTRRRRENQALIHSLVYFPDFEMAKEITMAAPKRRHSYYTCGYIEEEKKSDSLKDMRGSGTLTIYQLLNGSRHAADVWP